MASAIGTPLSSGISPLDLGGPAPRLRSPLPLIFQIPTSAPPRPLSRSSLRFTTRSTPGPVQSESMDETSIDDNPEKNSATNQETSEAESLLLPNKDVNRRIALASVIGAIGLFSSSRLEFGISLKDLSASAVPYEEALSNGRPTVVEFYADWCEVCRELAPDVYKVERQYKDRVNFVMLNVDNTKWEQELDEFGVEGIPHFAFLDKNGNEEGNVVGRLPQRYLLENVAALANGEESVPHSRVVGQFSNADSRKVHQVKDPRSHG